MAPTSFRNVELPLKGFGLTMVVTSAIGVVRRNLGEATSTRAGRLGFKFWASLVVALACSPIGQSIAAEYPDRPVTLIHAYPAGTMDVTVRYLADKLSVLWKQPVLVVSKPGASEMVAGNSVAKAAPDGYTLLVATESLLAYNQYLYSKMLFSPERDLVPISELFNFPFVLMVPSDLPVSNLSEFGKLLRGKKSSYQYASTGIGGPSHISMEVVLQALDAEMLHVPYSVGPQISQDLAAGRVHALIGGINTAMPLVTSGKAKVLGVSGSQKLKALPSAPTFAEAGYPLIEINAFVGLMAPTGTPPPILEKIHSGMKTILFADDFMQKIGDPFAYQPVGSSPPQFGELLQQSRSNAQKRIKALGLKPD